MLETNDQNRVRTLTLNRPEALNAFNNPQFDEVAEAFLSAREDDDVRVVVLTGAGRAFSAGADLSEAGRTAKVVHGFGGMAHIIAEFPKPFVVAVNGLGVGVGATVCGLADFAFMAASARLRCPFSELGLVAEAGSTMTFPALMGRQKAAWMLMSSDWMSAEQCKDMGLVLDVFPDDVFTEEVHQRAAKLAALPPGPLAAAKRLINGPEIERLKAVIDAENAELAELSGGPANLEAVTAFREKRPPDFSTL
jgi:enoyl-CoA hydratase/carnithine racemase